MTDEEKRMVEFNNYIDDLIKFMNGETMTLNRFRYQRKLMTKCRKTVSINC